MNFRTRILTARPSRIIFLVVILAALTPLFLQTENETHAQTGTSAVADAPALKVVSASASAVELSWTLVSDAVGYDLRTWWDGADGWQRIDDGSLTGTSDTHDGVTAGRKYFYIVAGVDGNGNRGPWSDQVAVTVPESNAPTSTPTSTPTLSSASTPTPTPTLLLTSTPTPTLLLTATPTSTQLATSTPTATAAAQTAPALIAPVVQAEAGAGRITLTWDRVANAVGYDVRTWYEGLTGWQRIDDGSLTATSFIHPDLTPGRKYHYIVAGVDGNGVRGPWSVQVAVTVPGSDAPTPTPTSTPTLSSASTPTPTPTLLLTPTSTPTPTATQLVTSTPTATPTPTATASAQTAPALIAPVVQASAGPGRITLTWATVAHAVGYDVRTWWTGAGGWQRIDDGSLTVPSFIHPNLTPGRTYHYIVAGLDGNGELGPWSQSVSAVASAAGTPTPTSTPATTQRGALIALYEATDGDNWVDNDNWLSDKPLYLWYGVRTDGSDRVTTLNLHLNNLSGQIPDLSALANLYTLDLGNNNLSGPIPDLSALTELGSLILNGNQLSGPIPNLSALTRLLSLNLGYNQLNGPIPDLSALTKLVTLILNGNQLSGPIPDLSALTNLGVLNLTSNRLTGTITDLGALTNLQQLYISNNRLTGTVPTALGNLIDLNVLFLAGNQLLGCIPTSLRSVETNDLDSLGLPDCAAPTPTITPTPATTDRGALVALYEATDGANWKHNNNWLSDKPLDVWYGVETDESGHVIWLYLEKNELTGPIPDLSALTKLGRLHLTHNRLSGPIPDLSALTKLRSLSLFGNRLSGPIPDLSALTNLRNLALANNRLSGPIPDLNAVSKLLTLDLSGNDLTGPIPDLSAQTDLKWLFLDGNRLSGPIPNLSPLTNLTHLYLRYNQLSGPIPDLSALTELWHLYLNGNQLTGPIPDLSPLTNLRDLSLGNNELTGEIPDLSAFADLDILHLGGSQLSGPIPDLSALTNLEKLDLGNNRLSGPILDLNNLINLTSLHLDGNDLTGPIPDLNNLINLTIVDLTDNRFCLPAGASLSHANRDVTVHLNGLNLAACTEADLPVLPAAPKNLTATVANGRVTLAWDALTDAAGYELWTWDSLDRRWNAIGGALTAATYTHTVLTDGRNYYFQVRARDANGVRGPWSQQVHVIVVPQRFPPPPPSLGLDILYQKYMVVVEGVFVAAPSEVSDEIMIQAGEVFTGMLSTRPDLLQAMADFGTRIFIYFEDLPNAGKGQFSFSAHLSKYLLHCGNFLHEYAHLIHFEIRDRPGGQEFDARIVAAYNAALDADLYGNAYASSNMLEYWAEMVQFWFQGQVPDSTVNYPKLEDHDPEGAKLVEEVFGDADVPAYCKVPPLED